MTREWFIFFQHLNTLVGGGSNDASLLDLQVGPHASEIEISNVIKNEIALNLRESDDILAEMQKQIDGISLVPPSNVITTSGSSILYGDGAGGFSNAVVGTGLDFTGGVLSATTTSTYLTQVFTAQTSINVVHNFGIYPLIEVVDVSGIALSPTNDVMLLESANPMLITHNTLNDFTVTFASAATGTIIASSGGTGGGGGGGGGLTDLDGGTSTSIYTSIGPIEGGTA